MSWPFCGEKAVVWIQHRSEKAYPKLRVRRTLGDGTSLSFEGLGMTWRPGDILRTSHAKEVGLVRSAQIQALFHIILNNLPIMDVLNLELKY